MQVCEWMKRYVDGKYHNLELGQETNMNEEIRIRAQEIVRGMVDLEKRRNPGCSRVNAGHVSW